MRYERGDVVKGPDVFGPYEHRPYVCLTDDRHPFSDEEALHAAVTTTERSMAVPLADGDFETGGLPRESYVNPWTVTSLRHADIAGTEGRLTDDTVETILNEVGTYLGLRE